MNKKRLWFRAKTYGWGWYPITWEGWAVLVVYILFILGVFFLVEQYISSPNKAVMIFLPLDILATLVLLIVCWKTGEKPHWSWGRKK